MKISIIVTHLLLDKELVKISEECIRLIRANTYNDFELINIDNQYKYPNYMWLTESSDIYVGNRENKGNAMAWDQGVGVASCDTIILMDNDVFVEKDWDKELVDSLSYAGVTFPYSVLGTEDYRSIEYKGRKDGFCFAFKKETYKQCGPFLQDQPFHSYFEDDHFFMNVIENGAKLVACEGSKVFHKGQGTTKKMLSKEMEIGMEANKQWFENKHNKEYPYLS